MGGREARLPPGEGRGSEPLPRTSTCAWKGAAELEKKQGAAKTISFVMAVTLTGKVLGLYRDRLLAIHYDTGMEASAFFTASRIL